MASCIVIATNDTAKDLKRVRDLEMIRTVQKILDRLTAPKWYRPDLS